MVSKLNVPPAVQRRAIRQLDRIANDPSSPTHSATTAARTLLARAKSADDEDGRPETRPALLPLPSNDRDREVDEATSKRILAGEFITVIPLYNDREPDFEAKNEELVAAITAALDAAYPEVGQDPGPAALQAKDEARRRAARLRQRRARARRAAAAA